jgi:SnoaL-like domain
MSDVTTTDVTTTVDTYLSMWNETDPATRANKIRAAWTEDGHYVDPLMESKGYDGLSAMVDGVQAQFPGHSFRRTTGVDTHHGLVRFGWELVTDDGTVAAGGIDIGVLAEDGRFSRIAGFLGDLPAAA